MNPYRCRCLVGLLLTAAMLDVLAEAGRWRRSDDPNPIELENLVQQQAMTIQTLQTRLEALESTCSGLSNNHSSLTARVGSMSSRIFQQVAFSAHYSYYTVNVGQDAPLKFDEVLTNVGNDYNPATGIFTARVPGVYLFNLHIINDNVHGRNIVVMYKSGQQIAEALVEGPEVKYDRDSATVTVHLAAGDTVYVKHGGGADTYLDGSLLCSFTGVLVTPDDSTTQK